MYDDNFYHFDSQYLPEFLKNFKRNLRYFVKRTLTMNNSKFSSCETSDTNKHECKGHPNEDDDMDPINAYFKQRCNRSSISSIFNPRESQFDSLGILDVNNMVLLQGQDGYSNDCQKLLGGLEYLNKKNLNEKLQELTSGTSSNITSDTNISVSDPPESELKIRSQREMAKKNLLQLNSRLENCIKNLKTLYDSTEEPVKTTTETEKKILNLNTSRKMDINDWFQKNPTVRYFGDELHTLSNPIIALGTGDSVIKSTNLDDSCGDSSPMENKERMLLFKDIKSDSNTSELGFETQNPDEILNRLEEDEKNFIKDQSAISNNSEISHFSGITEDKTRQCYRSLDSEADIPENDRISIGKYFELRSHSINSLIGAKGSPENSDPPKVTPEMNEEILENEKNNLGKPSDKPYSLKNESKRWQSSCELKMTPDISADVKHSMESFGSTSTLLIQDLLRGMDSGLSGTQINDRLLECLGKRASEKKKDNNEEHMETPKSSKTGGRIGTLRNSTQGKSEHGRQVPDTDLPKNQFRSPLAGKKSISKSCSQISETNFEEEIPRSGLPNPKCNKKVQSLKNEHVGKGRPFDSSTPKLEYIRSGPERFKSTCSKLLLSDGDWAMPRVSSIRKPKSVNDSISAEEYEKTVVLNSTIMPSDIEKKDGTINADSDSRTIEDTIAAGDLTLVSERIKEMKKDSAVISSPCEEKDVLAVVQELANFPKGSVDCSALTPLLRDQFPELLSTFSLRADQTKSAEDSYDFGLQIQESVPAAPDIWVKFSTKWLSKELCIAIDTTKLVSIQMQNQTKDWLIASLQYMSIQCPSDMPNREKYLAATKVKDVFHVGDFLSVTMKDTLISPGAKFPCKIYLTPKVPVTLLVRLRFVLKKLIVKESRTQDLSLKVKCLFPRNNISVIPSNDINFGVIPEECSETKMVQVAFDGECELPLKIYVDKFDNFLLSSNVTLNGERLSRSFWKERAFCLTLKEGVKSVLQLKLIFRPRAALDNNKKRQVDLNGTFSIALDIPSESGILHQVQLHGSVAFTKFLCISSTPLIFRVTGKGNSVKKPFPLKNIGGIELRFTLSVVDENSEEQTDDLFTVPNTFIVPKDEERHFDIVFSGETSENYVRRNLLLQLEPNGMCYEVELTGAVMPVLGGKPLSRASSHSGPTHSAYNAGSIPFHIKSTTQTISWAAVPLDVERKQTFFIMNSSKCNAMARFSFRKETSAFKFLNDNGEAIEKLRKLLKPNCSNVMTAIFRPNSVGPHINSIIIETNNVSGRKMISINGYGGSPKIFVRNLKSDLNGSKIIRLINSEPEDQMFHATLEFVNKGNISGFVSIKTIFMVLSLSYELEIKPSNFVVPAYSKIDVRIGQKLKNDDIKQLLSGKDICKLATVTVTTGDEPSRLRLKKLWKEGKINTSDSISFLLKEFINEKDEDVQKFDDDKNFESVFRKNLETVEIAAIVERTSDECESTILEVAEETVKEFVTILPAADFSVVSLRQSENYDPSSMKKFNMEKSNLSAASSGGSLTSRNKNVAKWLETLDKS